MFTLAKEKRFEGMASEYALSIDYGTQNAFAALLWAKEGTVWHVTHEYRYSGRDVGRQKTDEDYVRDMEKFIEVLPEAVVNYGHIFTVIDPSAASFIEAMLRSKRKNGNNTFSVYPADNGVLDGIRDVASCIQRGVIKISEDCKETFKEFEGYAWDTSESEDKPIKINDHMMDALRYFVRTKHLAVPLQTYKSKFGGR
jgi:PBSX family phage terminase large subunit